MRPGFFEEPIAVKRQAAVQNARGYVSPEWQTVFEALAYVRGVKSAATDARGAQQYSETLEFTTWYRHEVDSGCQVLYRGQYYEIERYSRSPENRLWMVIYGRNVRHTGAERSIE